MPVTTMTIWWPMGPFQIPFLGATPIPNYGCKAVTYYYPDTNSALIYSPEYALFASYVYASTIYHCPSDATDFMVNGQPFPRLRSYALNLFMGTVNLSVSPFGNPSSIHIFQKSSGITEPSRYFTFQDVNPKSICAPNFPVAMWNPENDVMALYPFLDHNSGGVVSFADGNMRNGIAGMTTVPYTPSPKLSRTSTGMMITCQTILTSNG